MYFFDILLIAISIRSLEAGTTRMSGMLNLACVYFHLLCEQHAKNGSRFPQPTTLRTGPILCAMSLPCNWNDFSQEYECGSFEAVAKSRFENLIPLWLFSYHKARPLVVLAILQIFPISIMSKYNDTSSHYLQKTSSFCTLWFKAGDSFDINNSSWLALIQSTRVRSMLHGNAL